MRATICLPEPVRNILLKWSRSTKSPRRLIERATIVLACADQPKKSNAAIGRDLDLDRHTIIKWRNRFAAALERWGDAAIAGKPHEIAARIVGELADAPRSGRPAEFSAEQVVQIIAVACELHPDDSGRPISHWTGREVADEAMQRGIVATISIRHTSRLLKKMRSGRTS